MMMVAKDGFVFVVIITFTLYILSVRVFVYFVYIF